jgi:hypothetical protein
MIDAPPEQPLFQEQQIAQALAECGLKAGGFTVRYEAELQSIEIGITPAAGAGPKQFPCIFRAVWPEIVTFEDSVMTGQYYAYVND